MVKQEIIDALRKNLPFEGLTSVRVSGFEEQPQKGLFDIVFRLESGANAVIVYGEIKNVCTPKSLEQIAPWLARLKAKDRDNAFAIICPVLSPEAQSICIKNDIDFIDLAGNVSINVPSKFVLQRLGRKSKKQTRPPAYRNPFGGRSSRVLRVLLQNPKEWRLTEIGEELSAESGRNTILQEMRKWTELGEKISQIPADSRKSSILKEGFEVSLGSISKILRSLEEELLVRRRNSSIAVPEPGRLLLAWAQKYKERYRWNLRSSVKWPNPFGLDLRKVTMGFTELTGSQDFAFTGATAVLLIAPFAEVETIDVFVAERQAVTELKQFPQSIVDMVDSFVVESEEMEGNSRGIKLGIGTGPDLRIIYPYDIGVFMYGRRDEGIPIVSDIQAFLDLYAKGDRDLKQAEYLLEEVIEPRWEKK